MKQDTRKAPPPSLPSSLFPRQTTFASPLPANDLWCLPLSLMEGGGRREGNFPGAMRHITCNASNERQPTVLGGGGTMGAISTQSGSRWARADYNYCHIISHRRRCRHYPARSMFRKAGRRRRGTEGESAHMGDPDDDHYSPERATKSTLPFGH